MKTACREIKKREPKFRTEKIGTIEIDTGMLVIADPCRLDEVAESFEKLMEGPEDAWGNTGNFIGESGRAFSVMSTTGLGDGRYPVFAEIVDDPQVGERVLALHIHFDFDYCFADDEEKKKELEEREQEYLNNMNS